MDCLASTNCYIPSRTIFCHDSLDVLRGINPECIDLTCLDPPFNKNKKFTAPTGSSAETVGKGNSSISFPAPAIRASTRSALQRTLNPD